MRESRTGRVAGPAARGVLPGTGAAPHASLPARFRGLLLFCAPALLVTGILVWEAVAPEDGAHLVPLLALAPGVAAVCSGRRFCLVGSSVCALLALGYLSLSGTSLPDGHRMGVCLAILGVGAVSCLVGERRARLTLELARVREVATVAQETVLRPLPAHLEGLTLAAGHLSVSREAALGGDLYDVLATPYGVRVVMGDVRGHGLEAVGTVAAVLGSFREAAHEEPRLDGVLRRLERGLDRRLAGLDEEFVTLQLLELRGGEVTVHNCGHPWPYLLPAPGDRAGRAVPVSGRTPLPPLGLFPLPEHLPEPFRFSLGPGETLLLFTDGAEDIRDPRGHHFPLDDSLAELVRSGPPEPGELVGTLRSALLRHADGHFSDDVALLALRSGAPRVPGQKQPRTPHARQPVSAPPAGG